MSTSTATAYEYNVAGHLSFGAPKCEKAQKSSGFWANRTYRLCIKDNVLIDPACGSGNFLTETYLSLRKLENRVLYELESGQIKIGSIEDERIGKRISLNQFYGIEINDFAVSVAETALWISRLKANGEASMFYENGGNDFPLDERATIIHGNALSEGDIITDWEDILPASQCSYIMGNPPFIGQDGKNEPQRREMELIWGEGASGYLDYVTAWYKKAADYYGDEPNGKFAFVSTNSICQGTPVTALFKPLFISGWRISFAWPSFVWKNEAANMANVHVVIVGMDKQRGPAKLFAADGPRIVDNINPYLAAAPTFFVEQRTAPLSEALKPAIYGSKPADGGFLQIKTEEAYKEAMDDPIASKYVRRSLGATELINGKQRWCLWLEDASPQEIEASSFLSSHVHSCYEWRSQQKITGDAYKLKDTPHLFRPNDKRPRGKYLCMPRHFSGGREYFTAEYVEDGAIATDACFMMDDEDGFCFSIITSSTFMLWQTTIGGRLKSDCRFANTLVWNTFPVPQITEQQKQTIISAGQGVISARKKYEGCSLAQLYNPENFSSFTELVEAHTALNKTVYAAFGLRDEPDDGDVSSRLVELYSEMSRRIID